MITQRHLARKKRPGEKEKKIITTRDVDLPEQPKTEKEKKERQEKFKKARSKTETITTRDVLPPGWGRKE